MVYTTNQLRCNGVIEENVGIDYGRAKTYTVGTWLEVWMENYAKIKLRPSTFKTSQGFLKNHIKPQIGSIPLADLTSLDLQRFYASSRKIPHRAVRCQKSNTKR